MPGDSALMPMLGRPLIPVMPVIFGVSGRACVR